MRIINKSPLEIIDVIREKHREIDAVIALSESVKQHYKGSMQQYQAACLYALCKPYNSGKPYNQSRILEIGTGLGYSTSFIAQACPDSEIITISARQDESDHAKNIIHKNLGFKNVEFVVSKSWEYYTPENKFDVIFVDGDHAKVQRDLVWWDNLHTDGLIVFHDYCPYNAKNPQPHVFNVLNDWKTMLGKDDFDVLIVDDFYIGMCGMYKR